ncbi:hypothetical protein [Bradyrhizobium japonicum]|uniref:hypothetical protein n=1 Tax=Bradyrhizobium japonicum TaxID=375 RepID=UPI0021674496|nr:hypothetical protein [Bradyrhizobium japonicum]
MQRARRRSANDRIDEPAYLGTDRRKALFDRPDLHRRLAVEFAHHAVILGDILGDEIGIGEMLLDAGEHAFLDG